MFASVAKEAEQQCEKVRNAMLRWEPSAALKIHGYYKRTAFEELQGQLISFIDLRNSHLVPMAMLSALF